MDGGAPITLDIVEINPMYTHWRLALHVVEWMLLIVMIKTILMLGWLGSMRMGLCCYIRQ